MPEDKANKDYKKEIELIKINEIISGQEKAPGIKKEKEPITAETGKEKKFETGLRKIEGESGEDRVKAPVPVQPVGSSSIDQARIKKIENILSEGLEEIYVNLPPAKQREFKTAGEMTAKEINNLLQATKVKIKKIVNLIIKWLSIISGVNRFFIEQEAKIKADEIMKIKSEN